MNEAPRWVARSLNGRGPSNKVGPTALRICSARGRLLTADIRGRTKVGPPVVGGHWGGNGEGKTKGVSRFVQRIGVNRSERSGQGVSAIGAGAF